MGEVGADVARGGRAADRVAARAGAVEEDPLALLGDGVVGAAAVAAWLASQRRKAAFGWAKT